MLTLTPNALPLYATNAEKVHRQFKIHIPRITDQPLIQSNKYIPTKFLQKLVRMSIQ